MTELDAINGLLGIIGEAPIDSISDITVNEITDSCLAKKTLDEVCRDVQAEGWDWNTEQDYPVVADSSGHFLLPPSTLAIRMSPNRYPETQYVRRGLRLYDKLQHTFKIGEYIKGAIVIDEIILLLDWEEMPHAAQQYVMIRAGRIFSNRYINSSAVYVYTNQDEEYARAMLIRGEERSSQHNLLWGNDRGQPHGNSFIPSEGTRFRSN
jgi:hypothetical protein